jgi:hypothetical protein
MVSKGQPNPLLGPSVAGLIGSIPIALVTLVLFLRPRSFDPPEVS